MNDELQARVQVRLADQTLGWRALPRWTTVSAGRDPGYGLHLPRSWVPRRLCRLLPYERGWLVQVGPRPRMRVRDDYVGDHVFERRAVVALQEGQTLLSFPELDDWCEVGVVIGARVADGFTPVEDSILEEGGVGGTAYAARLLSLTPNQRQVVAVTYRHLLTGAPKPVTVARAAAREIGVSEQVVKNRLSQVRVKVNRERWGPKLATHEDVAHNLMHLTRNISTEDLPDRLR